jgi:hypothetical protein
MNLNQANGVKLFRFLPQRAQGRPLVFAVICALVSFALPGAFAADIDVLVIGCSKSFSTDYYPVMSRAQDPFNPQLVVDELQGLLAGDPAFGTVNVVFEDTYRSITRSLTNPVGDFNMNSYSLLAYYYWPDGKTNRMDNLKGAAGVAWDYVVILSDPSFLASTPGVYAKGVKLIVDKIREGAAQPILMMQWPDVGSPVPVADFGEVTYRVGDSGGISVAPAGYAWNDLTGKDSGTHPTSKGAYLAAATLYSKMLNRNATNSTYTSDAGLADLAYTTVQNHITISHYSGQYSQEDPFHAVNDKDRVIKGDKGDGSSTEDGFLKYGPYNNGRHLYNLLAPQISVNNFDDDPGGFSGLTHFHIGRNSVWNDAKRYRVWTNSYRYAFGFPFQVRDQDSQDNDGGLDMLYGIDIVEGSGYRGDQRTAYDIIDRGHVSKGVRTLPVQSIWASVNDEMGISTPFYADGNHYGADVNEAVVSYMMTLLTGRCPIGKNETATERERRRIGYETAWMMSTLNLRPPGYTVHPSDPTAKTIALGTNELMTVYFVNPPQTNVTVDVSISSSTAAIINPRTLRFDASNYDTIQNVKVTGLPGAAVSEVFDVVLQTISSDMCFSNLFDSWEYTITRSSTESLSLVEQTDRQESVPKNGSTTIDLQLTGSAASNTIFAAPFHGALSWSGTNVVYTPDADYLGEDSFAFAVNTGGTLTKGYITLSIEDVPVVNLAPSDVTNNAAVFNGWLDASGANYDVYVYYGTSDGGTNAGSWDYGDVVGSWTNVSTNVSYSASLLSGQTYYYTFMISNASEVAWAAPSWQFSTLADAGPPTVTTNYAVPYQWLTATLGVTNNFEAAVTNDGDGDGFFTWEEYWSGTSPSDSNSFLHIDQMMLTPSNVLLSWRHSQVDAGLPALYIQCRTNLVSGTWSIVGTNTPADGTNTWSAEAATERYYRLAVPVNP